MYFSKNIHINLFTKFNCKNVLISPASYLRWYDRRGPFYLLCIFVVILIKYINYLRWDNRIKEQYVFPIWIQTGKRMAQVSHATLAFQLWEMTIAGHWSSNPVKLWYIFIKGKKKNNLPHSTIVDVHFAYSILKIYKSISKFFKWAN